MTVEIHLTSFLWLVPLSIEKKISGIAELLDPFGVEFLSVWNGEGVIVADFLFRQPVGNFVFVLVFNVSTKVEPLSVDSRTTALRASLVEVGLSS